MLRSPMLWLGSLLFLMSALCFGTPAFAQLGNRKARSATQDSAEGKPGRTITFSKLVLRPTEKDILGASDEAFRIRVIEYLRKRGLKALGAENLVFNRDDSDEADLVLGGTLFDVECESSSKTNCIVGIEWELLDVELDEVIYRARVYGELHADALSDEEVARRLLIDAIDVLLKREKFRGILADVLPQGLDEASHPMATLRACTQEATPIDAGAARSLAAVAIVDEKRSWGSAFAISDDPFLLTAAHVVTSARPQVRFRNGHKTRASVIRVNKEADVALLRLDEPPPDYTCLKLGGESDYRLGASVYALGSPASQELSFSMSRGILSGIRMINKSHQLQTDASINPGNSGGPLVSAEGVAIGVTSWKLAGGSVEGLGFAVSSVDARARLGFVLGELTDQVLAQAVAIAPRRPLVKEYREPEPVRPVVNPVRAAREKKAAERMAKRKEDERREEEARRRLQEMTPVYVPILRWGGLAMVVGGTAAILGSAVEYDGGVMSRSEFRKTRAVNDIGWAVASVGAAAFVVSFPLSPSDEDVKREMKATRVGLTVDGHLQAMGIF